MSTALLQKVREYDIYYELLLRDKAGPLMQFVAQAPPFAISQVAHGENHQHASSKQEAVCQVWPTRDCQPQSQCQMCCGMVQSHFKID